MPPMQRLPLALPADVWWHITRFLPPEELRRLYGVNAALFDLSMKEEYRRVCFNGDKRTMKWLHSNVVRPQVRDYVRVVEIRPWQIKEKAASRHSGSFWWTIVELLTRRNEEWSKKAEELRKQRKVAKAIKMISDAVKELPDVREYTVQCPEDNCASALIHGLLPSLTNWRYSLVKLTLCVPPDSLLCLASVRLDRLETLELVFWSKVGEPGGDFRYWVLEPLAVFINNLHPTLEALSVIAIRKATGLDLAPLFKGLGIFSRLRHFDLWMPYDGSSFSTIGPLLSFVCKHKKLQSLKLATKCAATRQSPTKPELKEWIQRILDSLDDSFQDIQQINVALRPLKARATLDTLIRFLSIHGHHLTSLALTEHPGLTLEEVQDILRATNGFYRLERLSLNVQRVNEKLFTLLARRIPFLKHLKVELMHLPSNLDTFQEELYKSRQFYFDWSLKRIDISSKRRPNPMMEALFKECIPSLEVVEPHISS